MGKRVERPSALGDSALADVVTGIGNEKQVMLSRTLVRLELTRRS